MDHVVNLDAVHELSIVTHLRSNPIKLTVQFLKVGERPQVCRLDIVSNLFICAEVLHNHLSILDLLQFSGGLFEPLFKQTTPDLSFTLVE